MNNNLIITSASLLNKLDVVSRQG